MIFAGSLALFGLSDVTVSEFVNPAGRHFRSFSLARSSCQPRGDWVGGDTWYPGYSWRICHCPACNQAVGWRWRQGSQGSQGRQGGQGRQGLDQQWVGLRLDRVVDWEGFLLGPLSDISHLLSIRGRK